MSGIEQRALGRIDLDAAQQRERDCGFLEFAITREAVPLRLAEVATPVESLNLAARLA